MQHCAGFISAGSLQWPCRNKTCTVLHQVGVSFDLEVLFVFDISSGGWLTVTFCLRHQ